MQWEVSSSGATTFSAISGATSTTYSFTASSGENGNQYEAVFTNSAGSLTSTPATLTVDYVTAEPASRTVDAGNTVTFTVASSNPSGTDTVEWEVSSTGATTFSAISGATSTTYSFTASSGENGNQYEAVFSNSLGNFASSPVTLTVDFAPAVTASPTSQTVNAGDAATFTAAASGNPAPSVQWEVSTSGATAFSPISGATSTTYSFTASSGESGNQYEAVFSNTISPAATTTAATLTVDYVTTQPSSETVNAGNTATFTAASSNPSGNDTVQWEVSSSGATTFSAISGATSTTYSFTASSGENGNQYEAVFTNSARHFREQPRHVDGGLPAGRDRQPGHPDRQRGQHGDLYGGGQRQSGANRAMGSQHQQRDDVQRHQRSDLDHLQLHGQQRRKRQPVRGGLHQQPSIQQPPRQPLPRPRLTVDYVTTEPASQTVDAGGTATFTAASSNPSGQDTVQWEVSSTGATTFSAINGATSTTYSFTASSSENGNEYEAVFSNSAGTLTSNPAALTVDYVHECDRKPCQPDGQLRAARQPLRRRPAAIRCLPCSGKLAAAARRRSAPSTARPRPPTASRPAAVKTATSTRRSSPTASAQ